MVERKIFLIEANGLKNNSFHERITKQQFCSARTISFLSNKKDSRITSGRQIITTLMPICMSGNISRKIARTRLLTRFLSTAPPTWLPTITPIFTPFSELIVYTSLKYGVLKNFPVALKVRYSSDRCIRLIFCSIRLYGKRLTSASPSSC